MSVELAVKFYVGHDINKVICKHRRNVCLDTISMPISRI